MTDMNLEFYWYKLVTIVILSNELMKFELLIIKCYLYSK